MLITLLQVYEILRQEFHADYLVLAEGPCDVRCLEGQTMDYVANSTGAAGTAFGKALRDSFHLLLLL